MSCFGYSSTKHKWESFLNLVSFLAFQTLPTKPHNFAEPRSKQLMNMHSTAKIQSLSTRLSDFYLVDKNITANSAMMVILNNVFLIKRVESQVSTNTGFKTWLLECFFLQINTNINISTIFKIWWFKFYSCFSYMVPHLCRYFWSLGSKSPHEIPPTGRRAPVCTEHRLHWANLKNATR